MKFLHAKLFNAKDLQVRERMRGVIGVSKVVEHKSSENNRRKINFLCCFSSIAYFFIHNLICFAYLNFLQATDETGNCRTLMVFVPLPMFCSPTDNNRKNVKNKNKTRNKRMRGNRKYVEHHHVFE